MPKYETKLKLGRKLEGVDAATASDNQVSVLFRHDEAGADRHVSLSVESDAMTVDDVRAVIELLAQRGLFTKVNSRTWVSQPQASEARFGATTLWQGVDVEAVATALSTFLPGAALPAGAQPDALGRLREAERRVAEMERALAALKQALSTGPAHASETP
ncbi:MAG TPA: hypothetical protein VHH36_05825 [Candidatus Thermoplasmatota archaeon]|nr:hypothetical protein [Candidatus Thermoplasmatota archaeon]